MHDRTALGTADVSDEALAAIVADALGDPGAELLSSCAEVVPYDLEALTTAGRYWVSGRAVTRSGERPYRLFVKVVQSWSRTSHFAFVPVELRAVALAGLPWEIEPAVYASDLGERLPPGLTMPRAYAVREVDELSAALWLEAVDDVREPWATQRFADAARLLGRLAASPGVRPLADVGRGPQQQIVRDYAEGPPASPGSARPAGRGSLAAPAGRRGLLPRAARAPARRGPAGSARWWTSWRRCR
jgi:hypothetical protein